MRNTKHNMHQTAQQKREVLQASLRRQAVCSEAELYTALRSSQAGLRQEQVENNREEYGKNVVTQGQKVSLGRRLFDAFVNPFTAILFFLAVVSAMTDMILPVYYGKMEEFAPVTVIIIVVMISISGILKFIQETRSGKAAEKLLEMITTTCCIQRAGAQPREIPLEDAVAGDIVCLSVGDMIPADLRILEAKDLFVSQSSLTGESEPLEKLPRVNPQECEVITEYTNLAFLGSNVVSGTGKGILLHTGDQTLFASVTEAGLQPAPQTSFTKGMNSVSWILIRFMLAMVPVVFFLIGFTKGSWWNAFLFALSIAVGLTPEMLPMIVTTCLAKGAISMSKKKTIVKNINSIQDFGAIDILCTDKTGTLTQDKVVLEYHLNIHGEEDDRVLRHAFLNSYFQSGYKNLMDIAVVEKMEELLTEHAAERAKIDTYEKVDEIPFDFNRRRLSVVVADDAGKRQMITKGAIEEMLAACTYAEYKGQVEPLTQEIKREILRVVDAYNEDGMRVIAVAQKTNPSPADSFGVQDECDMVLLGYLAFLDPPKETTQKAIEALTRYGVGTKILTGDNDKVTRCIGRQVGLDVSTLKTGPQIDAMSDAQLQRAAQETTVFAKVSPDQKARVIQALQSAGHIVGYMGDGINDTPAMRAADIAISVDTAVDIAKEAADIVLLQKDLMVLEEGIIEGRKTYANMIKYIKMTASSNFGNVFSVLAAGALIPFLPMESLQLILLNLIYDLCCTAIPWDNVDEEFIRKPR
ncbi:MAG: magnesium-translocating P-type ATPase, partial [Lachnospiraceae bacterium]